MEKITRLRQRFVSTFIRVAKIKRPSLIKGKKSILKLPNVVKNDGNTRALVVTTAGFIKRGSLEPLFDALKNEGVEYFVYNGIMPDPTIACIEEALKVYKENNCECIIAVGGGSVMDASKIIGARATNPTLQVRDMRGMFKIKNPIPDLYVVPTTAGTGSEATVAAVITDEVDGTHYKYAITDFGLVPRYAVMYPEITLSLPKHITAATGMDALTHAVETYTNLYASLMVKKLAKKSVRMIFENLENAYNNASDIKARGRMLMASYYAGVAFTNNFVGYVHAVAHALGALYGLPHGYANAILLPVVMDQYGQSAYKSLAELAEVVGIEGESNKEKAEKFIDAIKQMNKRMEIPDKVKELKEEDFDTIVSRALTEANPSYPVPVIWDEEDVKLLLRRIIVRE
ncbi:MAG: iron-containing alcohol dehydrogenase [Lachnospiraceae bacterium]|nr:iron-containing alcohol dehydrogenase [Lachnospiraceae bacterium]